MESELLHNLFQTFSLNPIVRLAHVQLYSHLVAFTLLLFANMAHHLMCHQDIVCDETLHHKSALVLSYDFL